MDDHIYRVFGTRLKALREDKDVTQEELAKRVDLSRTSITNIEKGRQRIMLHQLVDLADALDAKPSDLMPAIEKPEPLRADVAAMIDALKREAPEQS